MPAPALLLSKGGLLIVSMRKEEHKEVVKLHHERFAVLGSEYS